MDIYYYKYKKYKTKYLDLSKQLGGNYKKTAENEILQKNLLKQARINHQRDFQKEKELEREILSGIKLQYNSPEQIIQNKITYDREFIKQRIAIILNNINYEFLNGKQEDKSNFFNLKKTEYVKDKLNNKEFSNLSTTKKIKIFKNTESNIYKILKLDIENIKKLLELKDEEITILLKKNDEEIEKDLSKIKDKSLLNKLNKLLNKITKKK